jgi:hypothetical protein
MSDSARYAVTVKLDSLNDIRILAENDHYHGAFAFFARFAMICRSESSQKCDLFQFYWNRNPDVPSAGTSTRGSVSTEFQQVAGS